ncbi:enoyl-CoA hydratase family protein [Gordonia sp. Z-3]|uniref:enoyl-CoA hydratase family protein n=1 Tax=Gordonia sp. Z-3 TaxID=3115408 RepID=UPI002E2867E6|nr:enoyl-CoA hydratase family protein [Gordonia sp. Z-3]MED5802456.1 enoyl-CoA hydratase family protein [Gordonia sp. Z-3]
MIDGTPEVVHTRIVEGIATLELDSPANRNALGAVLVDQLSTALQLAADDPGVRAVVLTHTGGTFCAGADLSAALKSGMSVEDASAHGTRSMIDLMRAILTMPKPVIARIDGHVRAGGLGLIGAADMVLAGPSCTFALTEARLGLAPSVISLVLLPKLTARAAGRFFLSGETFGPEESVRIGLVTEAFATIDDLGSGMDAVLANLRRSSPQGLAASKALTTAEVLARFENEADARAVESAELFGSEEARAGMTAFLSKRRPPWDLTADQR